MINIKKDSSTFKNDKKQIDFVRIKRGRES